MDGWKEEKKEGSKVYEINKMDIKLKIGEL